jgi:hypothetical protein
MQNEKVRIVILAKAGIQVLAHRFVLIRKVLGESFRYFAGATIASRRYPRPPLASPTALGIAANNWIPNDGRKRRTHQRQSAIGYWALEQDYFPIGESLTAVLDRGRIFQWLIWH